MLKSEAVFKYELNPDEVSRITYFCNTVDYCSINQFIGWPQLFFKSKVCYFYLSDESGIISFCQINERMKFAHIYFGPVCCDKEIMVIALTEIINYYKRRVFFYLGVQMYFKSGYDTDYVEYKLNKEFDIKYFFNQKNTFSSIEINLEQSVEALWCSFTKEHRRNIRKAINLGVTVVDIKGPSELLLFADLYTRMCKVRKIKSDFSADNINEIFNFLVLNRKGNILLVKADDGAVLGGAILVYQGCAVVLYKMASDPDRRDIPINHLLVYEIIKRAKIANFRCLDFWGYSHFVNESNPISAINRFKMGFGGNFTFLAKKMNISLVPGGFYLYKFALFVKKVLI